MKKLFLFLFLIFSAIISNGQTIAHTIDTVRITNDTAITTQTRVHGVTHQIEGYIIDTTLGLVARLATSINALAAPTLQSVCASGSSYKGTIHIQDNSGNNIITEDGPSELLELSDPTSAYQHYWNVISSTNIEVVQYNGNYLEFDFSNLSGGIGGYILKYPQYINCMISLAGIGSIPTQIA